MHDKKRIVRFQALISLVTIAGFALVLWTCKYPEGPANRNTVPETRLANVPANDTTALYIRQGTFPEQQLYWLGDDPDGYIIGFRYRWTSTRPNVPFPNPPDWTTVLNIIKNGWENSIIIRGTPGSLFRVYNFLATLTQDDAELRVIGDSLATRRAFAVPYRAGIVATDSIAGADRSVIQTPTTGTFIFFSPADSNLHRFEVASIDNSDEIDPTPATVNFWTLVSPGSVAVIDIIPAPNSMAIRTATERWLGLKFIYRSLDPNNSFGIDFSYNVDDSANGWSEWSASTEAYITALEFKPLVTGRSNHVFYVRARNRWGVLSPIVSRPFSAIVPPIDEAGYQKRLLVINNDRDGNGTRGFPTVAQVESVYQDVLNSIPELASRYSIWRTTANGNNFPPLDTLGKYTTILVLQEQYIAGPATAAQQIFNPGEEIAVGNYLNAGGNLIWSSSSNPMRGIFDFPTWATDIFHTIPVTLTSPIIMNSALDFVGVRGRSGSANSYPDVLLDSTKLAADSMGAIRWIPVNFPRGFAETITYFDSRSDDPFFEGAPVGIRFLAPPPIPPARTTYSVVYFGFPLYYAPRDVMIQTLRRAFFDVKEIPAP